MNEKSQNGDVVELNLPDYIEEQNAIPDVETESSFAENKEEIYIRNRKLAAEESYIQMKTAHENSRPAVKMPSAEKVDTVGKKFRRKLEAIFCAAIVAIVAAVTLIITASGNGTDAALEEADEKARSVFSSSGAGLVNLYISGTKVEGNTFENDGTVFTFGNSKTDVANFLRDDFSGYVYGEFDFSDNGAGVTYTLWSAGPIPDEYKRVLTDSEQEALAKEGIIIGCYPSRR